MWSILFIPFANMLEWACRLSPQRGKDFGHRALGIDVAGIEIDSDFRMRYFAILNGMVDVGKVDLREVDLQAANRICRELVSTAVDVPRRVAPGQGLDFFVSICRCSAAAPMKINFGRRVALPHYRRNIGSAR